MIKYIELYSPGQIDRYKISGMSVDDFLDIVVAKFLNSFIDITPEEYERHKSHELEWNYANSFTIERYVFKHPSKEARNNYNRTVRSIQREKFLETFMGDLDI